MPTFHARQGVGRPAVVAARGSSPRPQVLIPALLVLASRPHRQYHRPRPAHGDVSVVKCGRETEPSAAAACRPKVRGIGLEVGRKPSALPEVTPRTAAAAIISTIELSSIFTVQKVLPPRRHHGTIRKVSSITCTSHRQLLRVRHPPLAAVVGGCRSRCSTCPRRGESVAATVDMASFTIVALLAIRPIPATNVAREAAWARCS